MLIYQNIGTKIFKKAVTITISNITDRSLIYTCELSKTNICKMFRNIQDPLQCRMRRTKAIKQSLLKNIRSFLLLFPSYSQFYTNGNAIIISSKYKNNNNWIRSVMKYRFGKKMNLPFSSNQNCHSSNGKSMFFAILSAIVFNVNKQHNTIGLKRDTASGKLHQQKI